MHRHTGDNGIDITLHLLLCPQQWKSDNTAMSSAKENMLLSNYTVKTLSPYNTVRNILIQASAPARREVMATLLIQKSRVALGAPGDTVVVVTVALL